MNEGLEALVRSAQEERARQAPDPDRVLRALPALAARRRRRRRTGLAALAALAVLAVVLPAVLVDRTTPVPPTAPPSVAVPAEPAVPTLTFRPTWIPPGFKETIRSGFITADEALAMQTWTAQRPGVGRPPRTDPDPAINLGIRRQDRQAAPPSGTPADVNGVTGTLVEAVGGSSLVWAVDATHLATLRARGVSRTDLLRVAASVRHDEVAVPPPLKLDWLPSPPATLQYSLSGDTPVDWNATLVVDVEALGTFTVMLAPTTDAPADGEPVPVGTDMGRVTADTDPVTGRPRQIVVLQPPASRYILTVWFVPAVGATLDRDALLRLVGKADTDLVANSDWIGT
ncbi:hypothetical protein ACFO1B_20740 [Dactylosporangium siamense]|uniref:Uncharacterized protein n=1 Tax=Dactylosporangium siamense TaxID=685454 RepID=A0A919PMF7_9ACTN|nr:hypothetical protein [Dactylosporangium siamense]GIG46837.1 hypothetical protein Dsi01nite_048780 [Dactylosporangium siamense]